MDWKDILKQLAPTVATAVAGPLGGAAITAIGSILGIDSPTQDKIAKAIQCGQLTSDQLAEIKKLELQYQNEEQERGFRYEDLAFKDRDSARQREVNTGDKVTRNLAYFVIASFVAIVATTLAGWTKVDTVLAGTLIGYLSAKAEQVIAYYFGSSSGSRENQATMRNVMNSQSTK